MVKNNDNRSVTEKVNAILSEFKISELKNEEPLKDSKIEEFEKALETIKNCVGKIRIMDENEEIKLGDDCVFSGFAKVVFDSDTKNFHVSPTPKWFTEKQTQNSNLNNELLERQTLVYNCYKNYRYGKLTKGLGKVSGFTGGAMFKCLYITGYHGKNYSLNFMRFYQTKDGKVNCDFKSLQYDCVVCGKGVNSTNDTKVCDVCYPFSPEDGDCHVNSVGNICYNPHISFYDKPETILNDFINFVETCDALLMQKNNEIAYCFDNKFRVREFNNKQKWCLQEIIGNLDEIKDIKYFIGYWDDRGDFQIVKNEKLLNLENEHNFLNYYWCEYTKNNKKFRISMYYKDFDHSSGNIHVLPGAIQIWEKTDSSEDTYNGFSKNGLTECKCNIEDGKVIYEMKGGKPYSEFEWNPLFRDVQFWDVKTVSELTKNLNCDDFKLVVNSINSNKFYEDVLSYSKVGRKGNYKKYNLLKFKGNLLYYKTMYIDGYGYFTKYDGEEVSFEPGQKNVDDINKNSCGPNYYDVEENRWVIKDKFFK